jgi:hypothetical protein
MPAEIPASKMLAITIFPFIIKQRRIPRPLRSWEECARR